MKTEATAAPAPFEMRVETIANALITPFELRGFPPPRGEKAYMAGCVYRADSSKVTRSERFGGYRGDWIRSENPEVAPEVRDAKALEGRGLYLGNYMGPHYGHFLTETLSTFWCFDELEASAFDYFVFHPFAFGIGMPPYVKTCLESFGIDLAKVVFVEAQALRCRELLVPERLMRLNHSADPRVRTVYRRLAAAAGGGRPAHGQPRRIYVSRRRFSRRNSSRVLANEVTIERLFRSYGFEIIYPEDLTFAEQVALYAGAEVLAGQSGSALHNALFMSEGGLVIELGDFRYGGKPTPTQALCNYVAGVESIFVPFRGRRLGGQGAMMLDIASLREAIRPALGDPTRRTASATLADLGEIAYLAARPLLGAVARGTLKKLRRR